MFAPQSFLFLCAGLAIVVYGADEAIKRLLNLSKYFRLSVFVTGVVIAGTIAVLPEMSIGVIAALEGTAGFGLGLILGSNVADLTLVLGIVVLFAGKLNINSTMLKEMRIAFIAVIIPVVLLWDGTISSQDGLILLLAFLVYVVWLLITGRDKKEIGHSHRGIIRFGVEIALFVIGITVLFIGSDLVLEMVQELNVSLGLPLFFIGTIVAIGTCLPELAFAIRAAESKNGELGFGNIFGNVLADSMLTIGVIALIQPIEPAIPIFPISTALYIILSVVAVYLLSRDGILNRKDGIMLILMYVLFLIVQFALEALNIFT